MNRLMLVIGFALLVAGTCYYLAVAGAPWQVRMITTASQWGLLGTAVVVWSMRSLAPLAKIVLTMLAIVVIALVANRVLGCYIGPLAIFDIATAARLATAYACEVLVYLAAVSGTTMLAEKFRPCCRATHAATR
jgi:hypothetical protein